MKAMLIYVILFLAFPACLGIAVPPSFELNLDAPPQQRWAGAVQRVLQVHPWEHSFKPVFEYHNKTLFNNLGGEVLSMLGTYTRQYWPEAAAELEGIAAGFEAAGHHVSFDYLAAWVWFHELDHTEASKSSASSITGGVSGCAAVLTTNGHSIFHARNMDQSPMQVRNITMTITVKSKNEVLFHAVDWYWITTGFMTVMKGGGFSVQENYRFNTVTLASVLSDIKQGIMPQVFVFRSAATHLSLQPSSDASLFHAFVNTLVSTQLAASMYSIVAGTQATEGVIITMGLQGALDQRWIGNASTPVVGGNEWSLVQTNYDPWKPDDPKDARRTAAQALLNDMGNTQASSMLGTYVVTTKWPVYNGDTAYTAAMHAASSYFHAWVHGRLLPAESP